jgi:serine/threonine protein kinase
MGSHRHHADESKRDKVVELNNYIKQELNIDLVIKKKLGLGAFGTVYKGTFNGETVAVKVEMSKESNSLVDEVKIYNHIHSDKKHPYTGLPKCLYYNSNEKSYRILVLPMLGSNLEDLQEENKGRVFSLRTTMIIAYQVLEHLKFIHSQGVVHKDIKPANMVILSNRGSGQASVSLLDFGMSRHYLHRDGTHIKNRHKKMIEGTVRFMGIHTHKAYETSRRDDFQSLAYTLIYFLKGRLPWQGLRKHGRKSMSEITKREKIYKVKQATSSSDLCDGLPSIFEKFLKYSLKLEFSEKPDYDLWRKIFLDALVEEFGNAENQMDWIK